MLDRLCPRVPSLGNHLGMTIVLLFALGSLAGGLRMLSTFLRPNDPWSRLGLSDRLLVGVVATIGGGVGVPACVYVLLCCR